MQKGKLLKAAQTLVVGMYTRINLFLPDGINPLIGVCWCKTKSLAHMPEIDVADAKTQIAQNSNGILA